MNTRRSIPFAVFLLFSCALGAIARGEPNAVYQALRSARPQGPGLAVSDLVLQRDVLRFHFQSGSFQFLVPVEKRVVGAVFVGDGSWELKPATEAERRHLELVSGEKGLQVLSDRFDTLVLLFTDDTASEIEHQGAKAEPEARVGEIYEAFLRKQRKDLKKNLQIRLLQDVLKAPEGGSGVFLAYVDGKKLAPALAATDPTGLDWFSSNFNLGGENSALYVIDEPDAGLWYLARRKAEIESGQIAGARPAADALHYEIETAIARNVDLTGTTTIRFKPIAADLRVLPLALLPELRIKQASFSKDGSSWTEAAFIQEEKKEDADAAVLFPAELPQGEAVRLRLSYEGSEVLKNAGEGNFAIGARTSWYPNLGTFSDLATFDLTYRVPKAFQVVSVGRPISSRVEGETQVSVWKSDQPIRVAGFNYGKFKKLEQTDKTSGLHIEVFTNPGTPDIIKEINALLSQLGERPAGIGSPLPADLENPIATPSAGVGLRSVQLNTENVAEATMADGINTARVCTAYFGPLPQKSVAITQQSEWSFGQSWPSLIFMPFLAFLDGTTRRELGLAGSNDFVEEVGLHEFAHQWWGHLVGAESYRDQWIEEGFSEFSAALVLQQTGGARKFNDFWERSRKWILEKPRQTQVANSDAGPITQGWRLSTRKNPLAYLAMTYSKGAYVLHMLRMLMRDHQAANPDENFLALMKDFVTSYAGKNASTRDFQTVVERHMVPAMNATGNGKMDWFFDQWVYGTEIPRYREKIEIQKESGDQYKISGSISQEGVSESFRALVHLYIEFPKGEVAHWAVVPFIGNKTMPVAASLRLPKKPKRVVVNAFHDVLARD